MYGLDKNMDLSFFIGKQLEQLCLGPNSFIMKFEDPISISVAGGAFTFKNKFYTYASEGYKDHFRSYVLYVLIWKKIIAASHGKGAGDLKLIFDDKNTLILHDDLAPYYESYNFWTPKGLVVV